MARACCAKPNVRIIKVAEVEAGLLGLDQALRNVYFSGIVNEEEIERDLLRWIKDFGNYISPSREHDYMLALLREYRGYVKNVKGENKMVVEFLSFQGCPHAPILRRRLDEALQALGVAVTPIPTDLEHLCQANDHRSGFGSPTILVDGVDLFGMECPSATVDPACRLYRPALPSTADVMGGLRGRMSGSR
jgi:hypothetical protein